MDNIAEVVLQRFDIISLKNANFYPVGTR